VELHPVLARQLKRLGLGPEQPPDPATWAELLARVDRAYREGDQERYTLERSLALSSEEMGELYVELKRASESALAAERDKLKESEKRYARAVQGTNDGIWDWDMQTGACYFSPRWKAQLGYGPEELADHAETFFALLHAKDQPKVQEALRRHLEQKEPYDVEVRLRQKNGQWRWIRARGQAEWDSAGNPVRMAGSHTDVTFQKAADAALRESEARFRALVGNVPGAVFRLRNDAHFSLQFMSEGIEPIAGRPASEFTSGQLAFQEFIPEEYRGEVLRTVSRSLVTREPFQVEFQVLHADGTRRWVEVQGRGVVMEDGSQPCLDGIILDITRQKEQQSELRRAKEAAEAATHAKSEFLANMSHEIRTPMNGVLGMTGFLLDTALSPEQREYAETVRSCAEGLLEIVNDILDFSKIEAGKLDLEPLVFDLREVVEDALAMAGPKANAKGLELACLLAEDLPRTFVGDSGRVRQVLVNLVGNAVKFTERGQVIVRVGYEGASEGKCLLTFEVEDSGIGISEEALPRLFHSFSQADGSMARRFGGTGLGLAISRQLVELMGGQIGVRSELGTGTTFHFSLRLPAGDPGKEPIRALVAGKSVLFAASATPSRECHAAALAALGLNVQLCDELPSERPEGVDGIVVDVVSLGESALEAALRLHKGVPMVALLPSGHRSPKGLQALLGRPVRLSSLHDALARAWKIDQPLATSSGAPLQRKGRVLVAEDNPVNQKVISKVLERMGLRVDLVANGLEAVEAASRLPYDLVLMDCQMPEMDGLEATAAIRRKESSAGRRLPIVALTAHAMQGEMDRCLAAGMDDYTTKPLNLAELERVLDRYLGEGASAETRDSLDPRVLEQLDRIVRPQGNFLAELVELFRRDLPSRMEALEQALAEGRHREGASLVHGLKGALGTLGALPAAELAGQMEQMLQEGGWDQARQLSPRFQEAVAHAWQALEEHLSRKNESSPTV
jgi:two-component system sensor histidine kinase/response regulator